MQQVDFTKPGGMPVTQNLLAFMQAAFQEMFMVLAQLGKATPLGANVAMQLIGMQALGGGNYSAGYFLYNGEIIAFPAQATPSTPGGYTRYLVIDITTTALAESFYNGTTPQVLSNKSCHFANFITGTAEDAAKFIFANLTTWA